MKIDLLKLGNFLRVGTSVLFATLALGGLTGIIAGNYLHFITMIGSTVMSYAIVKHW